MAAAAPGYGCSGHSAHSRPRATGWSSVSRQKAGSPGGGGTFAAWRTSPRPSPAGSPDAASSCSSSSAALAPSPQTHAQPHCHAAFSSWVDRRHFVSVVFSVQYKAESYLNLSDAWRCVVRQPVRVPGSAPARACRTPFRRRIAHVARDTPRGHSDGSSHERDQPGSVPNDR